METAVKFLGVLRHKDGEAKVYTKDYFDGLEDAAKVCEELLAFYMDDPGRTAAEAIRALAITASGNPADARSDDK